MSIRFVKDLASRIFQFIMSESPIDPVDDFEYPNHRDSSGRFFHEVVGKWKWHAAIGYQSEGDIHRSKVEELRWYKNIKGLEHEYMVVTCRRAGQRDVYLRIERRPENLDSKFVVPEHALPQNITEKFNKEQLKAFRTDVEAEQKIVQTSVWTTFQKSVPKSKNNLKAADSVTRVRDEEGYLGESARLIAGYQNFQRPFYVRDLAFLACAINEHDTDYQFFVHQCYWYARSLVNAAVEIYQPATTVPGDNPKAAGTYTVGKGLRPEFEGAIQVVVNNDCQKEIDAIKITLRDSIAFHNDQVQTRFSERHGEAQKANEIAVKATERAEAAEQQVRELRSQLANISNTNESNIVQRNQ